MVEVAVSVNVMITVIEGLRLVKEMMMMKMMTMIFTTKELVLTVHGYHISHPNMETRNTVAIPILEEAPLEDLNGSRLPTRKDVFRHFWYHRNAGNSIPDAQLLAAKAAIACWERVGLAPKALKNIKHDINKMNTQFQVA